MTAKYKAKELVNKYLGTGMMIRQAKQCALICVNEILLESDNLDLGYNESNVIGTLMDNRYDYWQEVKQEIKKL